MAVDEKRTRGARPETTAGDVRIRPLEERDLDAADEIMRVAFGTHLEAPNPIEVFGDAQFVRTRYRADPDAAFCAEIDGEVVGSNFATRWGSFGFFGPLTVRPDLWGRGIASCLMDPVIELFDEWEVRHAALFTFPESTKHVGLYNKFGFWPQQLNPVLGKDVPAETAAPPYERFSAATDGDAWLQRSCELTDAIYEGLDLEREILAVDDQGIGETILLVEGQELTGFAVCHCGGGSEAGSGACYVKFAAVAPGYGAEVRFNQLLEACEDLAASRGLHRLTAGVNTARHSAYRALLGRGYRPMLHGLTMVRPNGVAYNHPDAYVIDDLR
jgi:GNAT superfamily N-acetyltransferase